MKKSDWLERLRQWDSGSFDLTNALPEEPGRPESDAEQPYDWRVSRKVARLEAGQIRLFQRLYPWLAAVLCTVMIGFLLQAVTALPRFGSADAPAHNEVMARYVEKGMAETGAVNAVAGVILDYRAFDTLGESHVLFSAAAAVLILLQGASEGYALSKKERQITQNDTILKNTARLIVPVVLVFGLYVMFNGHLSPGGGFSGGAIVGAGLILYALSFGAERLERVLSYRTYRTVILSALGFYSLAKCYSFFCGANGLESGISAGVPGRIFSAGLILPLNLAVGAVVACTMYGFYSLFERGRI